MREAAWDWAAERYDDQIFDTIANDRKKVVKRTLARLIARRHTVCDFGCGVGRTVEYLARRASQVVAVDFSAASLDVARRASSNVKNVRLLKRDLSKAGRSFCRADVGLLMQVLIMPQVDVRRGILASVRRNMKRGGHLMAIVPSLEVALLSYRRLIEWREREALSYGKAVAEAAATAREEVVSLVDGVVKIDGTPTKHYLREEAALHFHQGGFEVEEVHKVEYSWAADFDQPPDWMGEPHPWDWLIVARKK